jgi:hypothetical protein
MSKRVLQAKEAEKSKTLAIKLPARLYDEIQAFKAELGRVAPHLMFNASALCAEALEEALKRARKELEQLQAEPAAAAEPEGAPSPPAAAVASSTLTAGLSAAVPTEVEDSTPARAQTGRLL